MWQYGAAFLILCIIYIILRNLLENCLTTYEIRRRLRKLIIKQELERLERGEIEVGEMAQGEWWDRVRRTEKMVELNLKQLKETDMKGAERV